MTFDETKTVLLTLFLVVPGFIFLRLMLSFRAHTLQDTGVTFLNCFILSCTLNSFWFPWMGARILKEVSDPQTIRLCSAVQAFGVLVLWPVLAGLIIGKVIHLRKVREWLYSLGFNVVHPIATAWEYAFREHGKGATVVVHLVDGRTVAGWYGPNSLASTDSGERDLYLQAVYVKDRHGKWTNPKYPSALLIKAESIKNVEFF